MSETIDLTGRERLYVVEYEAPDGPRLLAVLAFSPEAAMRKASHDMTCGIGLTLRPETLAETDEAGIKRLREDVQLRRRRRSAMLAPPPPNGLSPILTGGLMKGFAGGADLAGRQAGDPNYGW